MKPDFSRQSPDGMVALAMLAALAAVAAASWWYNVDHLAARLAWNGFSPTAFVTAWLHPAWFAGDFPSGGAEMLKSLPVLVYPLAAKLGLPLVAVMKAMIAAEIICLCAAGYWATRRLVPEAPRAAAILVALLLIAGTLRMPDMGRWGDPFFGWVYNFAYAAILVGVGALAQRRLVLAALAFAIAFSSHAVLGGLAAMLGAVMLLMDAAHLPRRTLLAAGLLFALLAGGWLAFLAGTSALGGGGIPSELYVAFTRMQSDHWYPVDMGLFWERHWERLFPLMAEMLLLLVYLPGPDGRLHGLRARLAAGLAAMLLLTALGVCISLWLPHPFLIKAALQRASSIFLLIAACIIMPGLWRDALGGNVLRAALAVLTLVSVFLDGYGPPLILGLALAAMSVRDDFHRGGWRLRSIAILGVASVVLLLLLWYGLAGIADWSSPQYWGFSNLSALRLLLVTGLAGFVVMAQARALLPGLALAAAMGALGILWSQSAQAPMREAAFIARADDYLAAQLWAQSNTPRASLFMPDPAQSYGWRDFSLRPSFGTVREWLYSGWIYNARLDAFGMGMERVKAMGLDPLRYAAMPATRPGQNGNRLSADLRRRYYAMDGAALGALSRRFGIAYFVFDRALREPGLSGGPVVYQNAHYAIMRAP